MYHGVWRFDNWYIIACGDLMNGVVFVIDFPQSICGYDYYIIHLLCKNYTSLHCSILSTCCIKATVHSIRYFNWQKNQVAFSSD